VLAAVLGFFLLPLLSSLIDRSPGNPLQEDGVLWSYLGAFGWMGIVALWARFLLGPSREKPSGKSCPNGKYLNQPYALICEASKQPYHSASSITSASAFSFR
jgi:hypothetical protein